MSRQAFVWLGMAGLAVGYAVVSNVLLKRPPALDARRTTGGDLVLAPMKRWVVLAALVVCVGATIGIVGLPHVHPRFKLFLLGAIWLGATVVGPTYMLLDLLALRLSITGSNIRLRTLRGTRVLDLRTATHVSYEMYHGRLTIDSPGTRMMFPFRLNGVGSLVDAIERAGLGDSVLTLEARRQFESVQRLRQAKGHST